MQDHKRQQKRQVEPQLVESGVEHVRIASMMLPPLSLLTVSNPGCTLISLSAWASPTARRMLGRRKGRQRISGASFRYSSRTHASPSTRRTTLRCGPSRTYSPRTSLLTFIKRSPSLQVWRSLRTYVRRVSSAAQCPTLPSPNDYFRSYFLDQNAAIAKGTVSGLPINLKVLGVGDGLTVRLLALS